MSPKSLLPSLWSREGSDDLFGSLHREIDRVFSDFGRGFGQLASNGMGELAPRIDVADSDKALEVSAELPGVDEKDVEVVLENGMLTIRGEKKTEHKEEDKEKNYHLVERSYGSFLRSIPVPFDAQPKDVDAKFKKGVLTVTIRKPPEVQKKTQKIQIKSVA